MSSLESLSPARGVELYLQHREPDLSEKSLQNHKYRLDTFLAFCREYDIDDLNDVGGRDIHRYRTWRREQDISTITLRSNLATLRVFFEFAAEIDAVREGLRERVTLPELDDGEEARDEKLDTDRAEAIIDYLDRFHYASRDHVIIAILWHTGIRLGSLRALDVSDFDREERCLDLRHRPEQGTRLKNAEPAERSIAVGEYYCQVLTDYLEHNREPATDEFGRRPLISSDRGRLSSTAIRDAVYRRTRPCVIGDCPHDRDLDECDATLSKFASECPSSRSPHGIRRGAITRHLRESVPEQVVSGRMNVSGDVLEKHYDRRTEREKMQIRREHLPDR
jgi:site-specific recombinase XerD